MELFGYRVCLEGGFMLVGDIEHSPHIFPTSINHPFFMSLVISGWGGVLYATNNYRTSVIVLMRGGDYCGIMSGEIASSSIKC